MLLGKKTWPLDLSLECDFLGDWQDTIMGHPSPGRTACLLPAGHLFCQGVCWHTAGSPTGCGVWLLKEAWGQHIVSSQPLLEKLATQEEELEHPLHPEPNPLQPLSYGTLG